MLIIGVLLVFAAIFIVLATFGDFILGRQEVFRALRAVRQIQMAPTDIRKKELATPFTQRLLLPALKRVGSTGRKFAPAGVVARLGKRIVFAGSPVGWDAERVLAIKFLLFGAGGVGGLLIGKLAGFTGLRGIIFMALTAFIGWYIPEWVMRSKSGKRQDAMRKALPDALDLLSITVEAGLGFDAAVSRVARQEGGPLGEELHRVLQEMQIGKSRADALRDLGERTTIPEFKSFVLAMIQADIFGISISKVLHVQAGEMRLKRRQRAEEKAQKVPIKIIFPLLACIFPALFVVLLGPAGIRIFNAFSQ